MNAEMAEPKSPGVFVRQTTTAFCTLIFAMGVMFLAGCSSIGPGTVPRDRADYSNTISDSWKRQTLMNIIKLRYLEPPSFVDVGQIVSGYSLETTAVAGGQLSSARAMHRRLRLWPNRSRPARWA